MDTVRHGVKCMLDASRQSFWLGFILMSKLTEILLGVLISGVMGILLAFVGVNFILGCETWDESLWTYEHSCLTPSAIWEGVKVWLNKT
mgnify:CR=1 FL=1